jgi:2-polyprenyl-3-methyl-5-hydroxy-6-metoxy-1,4-benzoquinol methylase
MNSLRCRFCQHELNISFIDLGMTPLSNAYISKEHLHSKEDFYPLHAYTCEHCFLVQLQEFEKPESIFKDYMYFSSYSESWLKHSKEYVEMMVSRHDIGSDSQVIEIASNDGYLLQYFKEKGIPVLGIEPAANVAKVAQQKGIPTLVEFFGKKVAADLATVQGIGANLIIANNVIAHVPNLIEFVNGLKILLNKHGIITIEFPHLLRLIEENQFDTIYHEHFSYFSLLTVQKIFNKFGLAIFDVEELNTHGGSLRIFAKHTEDSSKPVNVRVGQLIDREKKFGMQDLRKYRQFTERVNKTKHDILEFLIQSKRQGKTIVGYGAPAKGNTLLNYCGIGTDFLDYTVDRSPYKQGLFLPGTHIPIESPEKIFDTKPDYIFILPWNLKEEIIEQLDYIRNWDGKFIIPIPDVMVI